jgi:hypothetical protein
MMPSSKNIVKSLVDNFPALKQLTKKAMQGDVAVFYQTLSIPSIVYNTICVENFVIIDFFL